MARKNPDKKLVLDLTGLRTPRLSVLDILQSGSAAEVREELCIIGSLLLAGLPLPMGQAEWLGNALVRISAKEDASEVLRLKERANRAMPQVRARQFLLHVLDDYYAQCGSMHAAYRETAEAILGNAPTAPTPEAIDSFIGRLKELQKSRGK